MTESFDESLGMVDLGPCGLVPVHNPGCALLGVVVLDAHIHPSMPTAMRTGTLNRPGGFLRVRVWKDTSGGVHHFRACPACFTKATIPGLDAPDFAITDHLVAVGVPPEQIDNAVVLARTEEESAAAQSEIIMCFADTHGLSPDVALRVLTQETTLEGALALKLAA